MNWFALLLAICGLSLMTAGTLTDDWWVGPVNAPTGTARRIDTDKRVFLRLDNVQVHCGLRVARVCNAEGHCNLVAAESIASKSKSAGGAMMLTDKAPARTREVPGLARGADGRLWLSTRKQLGAIGKAGFEALSLTALDAQPTAVGDGQADGGVDTAGVQARGVAAAADAEHDRLSGAKRSRADDRRLRRVGQGINDIISHQ